MTLTHMHDVKCPAGHQFAAQLWDSVNVTEQPNLRERVLNGELNVFCCPECKKIFYAEQLVIYHDEAKKLLCYVYPHGFKEDPAALLQKCRDEFSQVEKEMKKGSLGYRVEVFLGMDRMVEFLKSVTSENGGKP